MSISRTVTVALLAVSAVLAGCATSGVTPPPNPAAVSAPPTETATGPVGLANLTLDLKRMWGGFSSPVYLTNAGDGSGRIFVLEQGGLVKVIRNGEVLAKPYLDLRSKTSASGERGLLGMAFSPRFATDGKIYVDYTDKSGNTVIERYIAADPTSSAPEWSAPLRFFHIEQPYANHNGGCLQFGPDGYLYIGMGDGGGGGDPGDRAQNKHELLGKILRVDVSKAGTSAPYVIPPSNPSRATEDPEMKPRAEVWACGLRNPWRFSFDSRDGALWIADVGQDAYEEIDYVAHADIDSRASKGGLNFGWNKYEGLHAYSSGALVSEANRRSNYEWPVFDYPHPDGGSVTGGYVYRGSESPALVGTYVFADYMEGWIAGIRLVAPDGSPLARREERELLDTSLNPSSFGVDEGDELYLVDHRGAIYKVKGTLK